MLIKTSKKLEAVTCNYVDKEPGRPGVGGNTAVVSGVVDGRLCHGQPSLGNSVWQDPNKIETESETFCLFRQSPKKPFVLGGFPYSQR